MVAGIYAGIEYGMERARGKQDWVTITLQTQTSMSASIIGKDFNGLCYCFMRPHWTPLSSTNVRVDQEGPHMECWRHHILGSDLFVFSAESTNMGHYQAFVWNGCWKGLFWELEMSGCMLFCMVYATEECSGWRCRDRRDAVCVGWDYQPRQDGPHRPHSRSFSHCCWSAQVLLIMGQALCRCSEICYSLRVLW